MPATWTPGAILPNLELEEPVEGDLIALVPPEDERIEKFGRTHPKFADFVSRFSDAFGIELRPAVLVVRDDYLVTSPDVNALASFCDLTAISAVPYGRALASIFPNGGRRLCYSNSFWLHPWMLGKDNVHLVASTPAIHGFHVVEEFRGQSMPEVPIKEFKDRDELLFTALLARWKRHYVTRRLLWQDRALFRSLNMASSAALIPGGMATTLYELGRSAGLWVSAFEILTHPGKNGRAGLSTVFPLLENVPYVNPAMTKRRYPAPKGFDKTRTKCNLACWIYGALYRVRNDFLHGNPVTAKTLTPPGLHQSLFWCAPCLYRIALTGFLKLSVRASDPDLFKKSLYQREIESALLKTRSKTSP